MSPGLYLLGGSQGRGCRGTGCGRHRRRGSRLCVAGCVRAASGCGSCDRSGPAQSSELGLSTAVGPGQRRLCPDTGTNPRQGRPESNERNERSPRGEDGEQGERQADEQGGGDGQQGDATHAAARADLG